MTEEISEQALSAWDEIVRLWHAYVNARYDLHRNHRPELAALVYRALDSPEDGALAFEVAEGLTIEEKQSLLPTLLALCSSGRYAHKAGEMIYRLPREWLLENIEAAAEQTLKHNDYLDWANILALFGRIEPNLARRLARRASHHADPEIKECGEEYLAEHGDNDAPNNGVSPTPR
jgi:hypothetical protein